MALLESQQKRTTRLFEDAYRSLATAVPNVDPDWPEMRRQEYVAWYAGGSVAAQFAVTNCGPLKEAWGRGDERGSSQLTFIFTMPIILRFYGYTPDLEITRRTNLFGYALNGLFNIQNELPFSPEKTFYEYLELAKQFEFDEHATPKPGGIVLHYWIEMDYLLSTALTTLGKSTPFSMDNVKLPVASPGHFSMEGGVAGGLGYDLMTYYTMFQAVGNGFSISMKALRAMRGQATQQEAGRAEEDR